MSKVAFNLGSITISWYSICILTGIIIASYIIGKEAKKFNIPSYFVSNLVFWCVVFGIVGARIYYVLFNLDYYLQSPMEIIKVWNGGLAIHGGIIAGIITLILYCKKYNIDIMRMTDISIVGVIIAQAIGRWGNFFNSEAHGGVVTKEFLESLHLAEFIIDGMHIGINYYHPTFLYESLLCIIGFILLILIRKNKKLKIGTLTSIYFIWYGIIRYFIESLRTDSLMLFDIKIAQLVSIAMIIIGIILLIISIKKGKNYYSKEDVKNAKQK